MTPRAALVPLAIALAALAAISPRALAAKDVPEVTIENVRVGFGDKGNGNAYKIGAWTPIWVDLKGGPRRFEGTLEFIAPDESNIPTTIARDVSVPANEMVTVAIIGRSGSRYGDVSLRVTDRDRRRAKANWSGGSIESIPPDAFVVLASGQNSGLTELKTLTKYAGNNNNGIAPDRLVVAPVRPRDGFPAQWYGFDAADAVVLDTNDPATLARLRESGALIEWVRQGGHLVVAVGQNWQAVLDSPLGPILPAVPSGRVELNDPGLVDQFAGASAKPIVPPDAKEKLRVTKFEGWETRGGVVLKAASVTPLVVRGPYGFGRVTLIGIDVDQKPFASWEDRKLFWDKLLDLGEMRGSGGESGGNAMYGRQQGDLSGALFQSLQRFPGVRLVPFGWVAFFVFLYILLIGPGDYFFLRKVVKRMEYTWITFPLIVLTVSGVAYAAAYYFKGTDLRINKVDAVDVDQTTGQARGWSWLTLFSPQNRDYDVGFAPLPPDAEPRARGLADPGDKNSAGTEVLTSWFGEPESGGGGNGLGFGGGYEYAPMSEPEQVKGVRVHIWSTKSFGGRWSAPLAAPILEADLVPDGPDRLRGTVTNVTRRPLKNAALFFSRYVYVLNEIAPGATATLGEAQVLAGYLDAATANVSVNGNSFNRERSYAPEEEDGLASDRPEIVRALMFHGALGQKAAIFPSFALKGMDLSDHLELRRPMLVADVDGPATLLKLGGAGRDPKMKQTTVLRVILPLKPDAPSPAAKP